MKKITALILIFIMLASTSVFAAVSEEIKADLTNYGIMTDYTIPGINRAEAAKIVMTMMGFKDCQPMDTEFTDVPKEYWASGYIAFAQMNGVINGMGDGTFAPEEPLTNEQMIKILVCAIGYEPFVRVPYPTGHFMVANQFGITEGLDLKGSDIAKREDVAVMVYNAFDTPLMVQTGYGETSEFQILDGSAGTDVRTLRSERNKEMGITQNREDENKADPFDFDGPDYNKIVLKVENLIESDGTISFSNGLDSKDKTTYIVGNETGTIIFDLMEGGIGIEKIENGLYVQGWYKGDKKDTVHLIKVKLTKEKP